MTFPAKLAFVHPIWFLVLTVLVFVAPLFFTLSADTRAIIFVALMSVLALLLPLGWAHGIYRGARSALIAVGPGREWVFFVAEIGVLCVPILGLGSYLADASNAAFQLVVSLAMFPLIASYFASLWLASAALVAFEDGTPKVAAHKVVGTFLLMFYWMIGAWVMQRRLSTLRDAIAAGQSAIA